MLNNQIGATLLVAGTCIGSGMIAMPMLLAKIGILSSIVSMLVIWLFVYVAAMFIAELNTNVDGLASPGALGRHFSGNTAGMIGELSLHALHYSLLSAYIYGGGSILHKLVPAFSEYSFMVFMAVLMLIFLLIPVRFTDFINRILFVGMCTAIVISLTSFVGGMKIDTSVPSTFYHLNSWTLALPVLFTSFGFHSCIHSITSYCNKNTKIISKALLWGTLIPSVIYLLWTIGILGVLSVKKPEFYHSMIHGKVELGDLIVQLKSMSSKHQLVDLTISYTALLAIITSVIGVGMASFDSLKKILPERFNNKYGVGADIVLAFSIVLPPLVVAMVVPNAFIKVLAFAGMILTVIAIFLPSYLHFKAKNLTASYPFLQNNYARLMTVAGGILIVGCELYNLFF